MITPSLELLGWQIGYFILWIGFIVLALTVAMDNNFRKRLQKNGVFYTRKGTYTFTPYTENTK